MFSKPKPVTKDVYVATENVNGVKPDFTENRPAEYYQDALVNVTTELVHMLIKKHIDYGPNNLKRFGLEGIVIRESDKLERMINLVYHKQTPQVDESVRQELLDIAGYAIQGILLIDGKLDLPLKQKTDSE